MTPHIAILDFSEKISSYGVRAMASACNRQLRYDCAPLWGMKRWPVKYYPANTKRLPDDACPILVVDTPDVAEALGYHWETPDGTRYGKVFVDPILKHGGSVHGPDLSVSVTLSHECLEMMIDPDCNLWSEAPGGKMWAYEIADPVEAETYPIEAYGKSIYVSNFVTRHWFDAENKPGTRFDFLRNCMRPYQINPGGYMISWDGKEIQHVWGRRYPRWRKAQKETVASRTARRSIV